MALGISTASAATPDQNAPSGDAFDAEYSKAMVSEHEKTIELFETEPKTGADAELKAFAASTLPTLRVPFEHGKKLPR